MSTDLGAGDQVAPPARLMAAALEAFAERGFHGTTTRDIAKRASLSPAAIYVHHASKEALLYHVVRATHIAIVGELRRVFALPAASAAERLARLVTEHVAYQATQGSAARVANYELHSLTEAHRREIVELRHEVESMMVEAIKLGVLTREFDVGDEPRAVAVAILSSGIDVSRWYSARVPMGIDELAALYARLALRMVGATPSS